MASASELSRYKDLLRDFTTTEVEASLQEMERAGGTPTTLAEDFSKAKELSQELNNFDMFALPESEIQQLNSVGLELLGQIHSLNLSLQQLPNPQVEKSRLLDKAAQARISITEFCKISLICIVYLFYRTNNLATYYVDIKSRSDGAQRLLIESYTYVTTKKGEIDTLHTELIKLVAAQRELVGATAVGEFSTEFEKAANAHKSAARRWILGALGAAVLTAVISVIIIYCYPIPKDASAGNIAQHALTRFILLGLPLTAVFWCGRFYRSNKHLEVVNRHRFNGMRTFLAFTQAASSDETTRNAILLETTRAIYANVPTGYLGKGEDTADSDVRIIEFVKAMSQKGSP